MRQRTTRRRASYTASVTSRNVTARCGVGIPEERCGATDACRHEIEPQLSKNQPQRGTEDAALRDALAPPGASLVAIVEAVRALPYGRPHDRSVQGMLRERRGTCSTKHVFLADVLRERFPETEPCIVHRVYRVEREHAAALFGVDAARSVPAGGLADVHRYLTIALGGRRITIDATFPGPAWDGVSPMPLACGAGHDEPAGPDPDADKRALERQHCDPLVREPFIAALAAATRH